MRKERNGKNNIRYFKFRGSIIRLIFRRERREFELSQKAAFRRPTLLTGNIPTLLKPSIPMVSPRVGVTLHSARHTFTTTLSSAVSESAEPLKIPSPETLNRQMPQLLHALPRLSVAPTTSSASVNVLHETMREEEEAVAMLAALK